MVLYRSDIGKTIEEVVKMAEKLGEMVGFNLVKKRESLWGDILEEYDVDDIAYLLGRGRIESAIERERERRGVEWAKRFEELLDEGGGDELVGFPIKDLCGKRYLIMEIGASLGGGGYFYRLVDEVGGSRWERELKGIYEGRYYVEGDTSRLREGWDRRVGDRVKHRIHGVGGVVVGAATVKEAGVVIVPVFWDGSHRERYELGGDVLI